MNKIKFNFSLIFDLVKSCDLMIPFITRSTILSEEDASTLNHPDIVGMLTIDEFMDSQDYTLLKEQSWLYLKLTNLYELYR